MADKKNKDGWYIGNSPRTGGQYVVTIRYTILKKETRSIHIGLFCANGNDKSWVGDAKEDIIAYRKLKPYDGEIKKTRSKK